MLKFSICSPFIGWLIIFVYVATNSTRELSDNVNSSIKINEKTKGIEEGKNVVKDEENVLKQDSKDKKNVRNKEKINDLMKSSKRRGPRSATDFFRKIGNLLHPYFRKFEIANTKGSENPNISKEAQVEIEMKEKEGNKNVQNYNEGEDRAAEMRAIGGSKRIVGGFKIPIEEVPYQLAILLSGDYKCGASVISPYWALTAAHCVDDSDNVKDFTLRLGSNYSGTGGLIYEVGKIIFHPKFQIMYGYPYNDAAVLQVVKPFNDFVGVGNVGIPLTEVAPSPGTKVMVSGWGNTGEKKMQSPMLLAVEVEVIDRRICNRSYNNNLIDTMLCAGNMWGGQDACFGDSGGPLVIGTKDRRVLVGIVSFGEGCARLFTPGVYTNVAAIRNWILEQTKACQDLSGSFEKNFLCISHDCSL